MSLDKCTVVIPLLTTNQFEALVFYEKNLLSCELQKQVYSLLVRMLVMLLSSTTYECFVMPVMEVNAHMLLAYFTSDY